MALKTFRESMQVLKAQSVAKKAYKKNVRAMRASKISRRKSIWEIGESRKKSTEQTNESLKKHLQKKSWKYTFRRHVTRGKQYVPVKRRFESYQSELLKTTAQEKDELASFFDVLVTDELNDIRS